MPPRSLRACQKALAQEGILQEEKDHGRLLGEAIEAFKLLTTSESQLQSSQKENVRCYYLWDSEVVQEFANDVQIRRRTPKKLFQERLKNGVIRCHKDYPDHLQCCNYKEWKVRHAVEAAYLKQEAQSNGKSLYIALSKDVLVNGKVVHTRGGIKSLQPPCQEEALSYGKNPFTCENCFRQLRELKDIIQHRKSGSLYTKTNRLGLSGLNKCYARRGEAVDALEIESQA